jgi:ankyrin repeat protein
MKIKPFILLAFVITTTTASFTSAATNDVSALLQKGLFEEEANRNLDAAIQAYQSVITESDKNHKFAATAIFRLGECYRKQGKTKEAAAQYERILREFADQTELAKLSEAQVGHASPGQPPEKPGADVGLAKQIEAVQAELHSLEQQYNLLANLKPAQLRIAAQQAHPNPVLNSLMQKMTDTEQELAKLKVTRGDDNPEVIGARALLKSIQTQIDDQTAELLRGLFSRSKASHETLQELEAKANAGKSAPPPATTLNPPTEPAASREAEEIKRIQALLKESPDLINPSDGSVAPLLKAVESNRLLVAKFLLDNGADVNSGGRNQRSPITLAAEQGYKEMIELLLSHGADVNDNHTSYVDRHAPLHLSAQRGYKGIAEVLLAHKADVNIKTKSGLTPLHLAAENGFTTLVTLLLANGADVAAQGGDLRESPLHKAAASGNSTTIELLLAKGADVNAKDRNGATPLIIAIDHGRLEIAKLLLAKKADVNASMSSGAKSGWTSLHLAVDANRNDLVKLLLDRQANPDPVIRVSVFPGSDTKFVTFNGNSQSFTGITPLAMAAYKGQMETAQLLIDSKANVDSRSDDGSSPLLWAAKSGEEKIAALLLAHEADVNAKAIDSQSALHVAISRNSPELLQTLLAYKPALEIPDGSNYTPLQRAVSRTQTKLVALLLDAGANANAIYPMAEQYSPVEMAVLMRNKPLVELLLSHHANVNLQDHNGGTALSLAKSASRPSNEPVEVADAIAGLLLKAGADENLQRRSMIGVSRGDHKENIFFKGTNAYNRYTLFELLAAHYAQESPGGRMTPPGLPFPDFAKVKIHRLEKSGGEKEIPVDLAALLQSSDCSRDLSLEWGDTVEIPELDHKVNETWHGLGSEIAGTLVKCLERRVQIVVKGEATQVLLKPGGIVNYLSSLQNLGLPPGYPLYPPLPQPASAVNPAASQMPVLGFFRLKQVVGGANVLLASSDMTRVKVTRRSSPTANATTLISDLETGGTSYNPATDLWLRDGDVIEIPEKP